MNTASPDIRRDGDDRFELIGLDAVMVETLLRIPLLLPDHPEAAVIEQDLAGLEPDEERGSWGVSLAAGNAAAWLTALAGAKLTLYRRHQLSPGDLDPVAAEGADPDRLLAHVHLNILSLIQTLIRRYHRE